MNNLTVQTEDSFSNLLDLAANNDVEGFKRSIECDPSGVDEIGLWYGRQKGSKQMVNQQRTPLMVAATYGNVEVLKLILMLSEADVNLACGSDKSTALHCAAFGGFATGADPNGLCPINVIVVPPKLQSMRVILGSSWKQLFFCRLL